MPQPEAHPGASTWGEDRVRGAIAYLTLALFVLLTAAGAALVFPPAGLIVAGLACLVASWMLGNG